MRLLACEQECIVHIAHQVFGVHTGVVLFGSRVRDDSRGGDIDLLIVPKEPIDQPYNKKLRFRSALKNALGDQKIDVVLAKPGDARMVVKHALATGVEL